MRPRLQVFGLSIFLICLATLWLAFSGEQGVWRTRALGQRARALELRLEALQAENDGLRRQIQGFRSNRALLERVAREDLGLVRPQERIFRFDPAAGPDRSGHQNSTQN